MKQYTVLLVMLAFTVVFAGSLSPLTPAQAATPTHYYVATNGSDNNPGTEARPFRTLAKGVRVLRAGDTLYIREGTYHEEIVVSASGTADSPITLSAYPGEHPIVDAENVLPLSPEESLFLLTGDHLILSGLEIKNVRGLAVQVEGSYTTVRNMKTHHSLKEGIYVGRGGTVCSDGINATNNTVEDNEIWMSSLMHKGVTTGHGWSGGISVGRCPQYTMVRRNVVHETWGIGIQVYEAYNTTIEDNVVWNNQKEHYYVNNAPYTLVQRNLSYNTPDSIFLDGGWPGVGIAFCDERPEPVSHHVTIINNLVRRGSRGFMFFSQQPGTGLKSFLIANNTFVDSTEAGLEIRPGDHENSRIQNNIIFGQGTAASVPNDPGLNFSHNLWSKAPLAAASGAGDMLGDPHLAMSGPTGAGLLKPDWFKLLPNSPAIDVGISLSQVPNDFDGVSRSYGAGYDIGAYEWHPPLRHLYMPLIMNN